MKSQWLNIENEKGEQGDIVTKAVQSALSIRPGDVFLSKSVNPFQFLWCWFVYFIMTFNLAIKVEQEFSDVKKRV